MVGSVTGMPSASRDELASIPLFRSLDGPALAEVAGWFEVKDVGPGVRLVGEGTTGCAFFVVGEGEVSITARGAEIAVLGPGDFFGEMAMLGDGRRTASVTTTSPARVLVLFTTEFERLKAEHPAVADEIEAAMLRRSP